MLLRASRTSSVLVKEALAGGLVRRGISGSLGAASGLAKGVGRAAWKHKKGLGIGAVVAGVPAATAVESVRRGNVAMNPGWTAARMQGRVPAVPR